MGEIFERMLPDRALDWTGERLTTATSGQVEIEHLHRYFLARDMCRSLDVLDVASGEGYGSALLAQSARSVVGVEISEEATKHAAASYVASNLRFRQGDARDLPIADATVDVVVSFETLEHFFEHDRFITEVRRVLRPGGKLIISSPERDIYSPLGSPANPYHVHELSRVEFEALLRANFRYVHIMLQRPMIGSALVADNEVDPAGTVTFEKRGAKHYEASRGLPRPPYVVAVASDEPVRDVPNSLFIETSEVGETLGKAGIVPSILQRAEAADSAYQAASAELARSIEQARVLRECCDGKIRDLNQTVGEQTVRADAAEAAAAELRAQLVQERADTMGGKREREVLCREIEELRNSFNGLLVDLSAARAQRDVLRSALRRRALTEHAEAEEWRRRYFDLRGRMEAILRRFGVLRAARFAPRTLRRFVRNRLLGPGSSL